MALVLVSFRPFKGGEEAAPGLAASGGDAVNQIGFGLLGLLCAWAWTKGAVGERWRAFLTPAWLLLPMVIAWGITNADAPMASFRAALFSAIVVVVAMTVMMLPRTREEMLDALSIGTGTAIAFCYAAVFFVPEQGVHPYGGLEAQHGGLWRGVFDHKNVASYVTGGLTLAGVYLMGNGRRRAGFAIALFAGVFTYFAGSKTVLLVAPLALAMAGFAGWIGWNALRFLLLLLPILALNIATLGAVLHPPLLEWLWEFVPGLTYTGRTDLWTFGIEQLGAVPWTGFGYESFWGTTRVVQMEQPIELSWDVRGIVHGHNSWLDAAIGFGLPGAAALVMLLVLQPLRDYVRIPRETPLAGLATLLIGIWMLAALGASLESFFLRRADPVWFLMLLAVVGLRLAAWGSLRAQGR